MKSLLKIIILIFISSMVLRADIHTDLDNLSLEGNTLNVELTNFTMNQESACLKLGVFNQSLKDYTLNVQNITDTMTAFSVTDADLANLEQLSYLVQNMSLESIRISSEMNTITDTAQRFEYQAGLNAILQLSNDIGAMADRILEMSDRILIMADNIGLMADKIISTQLIQSQNLALTQNSILVTQQNMVLLSNSLSTIAYNLSLGQIMDDHNALSATMNGLNLDSTNLETQLTSIETETTALLSKTTSLLETVVSNSAQVSHYIDADTLTLLGDLSTVQTTLAASLETYSNTIEQIAPLTDTLILSDATATMLQLTKDIGLMSERIIQMSNDIYTMADNIGLMADKIVLTQDIQMNNLALTQSSLLSSQTVMINLIKNYGL